MRSTLGSLLLATLVVTAMAGCESCKDKPKIDNSPATVGTLIPDAAVLNVTTAPDKDVRAMLNPENLPLYAGPTGSIEGVVTVSGPEAAETGLPSALYKDCPTAFLTYGRMFRSGPFVNAEAKRWLADAIVVVTGYKGYWVREKKDGVEVQIDGCAYRQRTISMTFGQQLEVKNLTNEFWTPILEPKAITGAMMMAPPHNTDPVKLYPKEAGRHALMDHDRKYVVNDLMVFRHPLHAVSDNTSGHYRIDNIPVGNLRVTASHMEIPKVADTREVDIKANEVTTVNLTINYRPSAPKDGGVPDANPPYPGLH